ncbi:kinase-like domain-containing protein [Trichoderma pleuroticola]
MSTNSDDIVAAEGFWREQPVLATPGFSHNNWNERDEVDSNFHKSKDTSDKYVKRIADGKLFAGKTARDEQLSQEIEILSKFRHKHILKFIELHQQGDALGAKILVTELCTWGDLSEHIHHVSRGMGKMDILLVISQIGDALAFIHRQNYYHADVKPRNILIRKKNPIYVVLADCADCQVHGSEIYGGKNNLPKTGTYKFWSLEMAANSPHNGKEDDVWALGITLLNMMAQLPSMNITCTKKGNVRIDDVCKHAKQCAKHAQDLETLNPKDRLVKLVGRMLIRAKSGRITAPYCSLEAKKLLEGLDMDAQESQNQGTEGLRIQSPEGFTPPSFW